MNLFCILSKMRYLVLVVSLIVAGCGGSDSQQNSGGTSKEVKSEHSVSYTVPLSSDAKAALAKSVGKVVSGIPLNTKISVIFCDPMDTTTITTTTFTLKQGTTAVSGSVNYTGVTAVFAPTTNLSAYTEYTATITTGARDGTGHPLAADYVWSFTTGASQDTTQPTVSDVSPASNATAVPINRKVAISFSEMMDPATINTSSISLKATVSGTNVPGTVSPVGTSATFTPASNLYGNTTYTATITSGVKDLSGNPMAVNFVFTFRTGVVTDTVPPVVSFSTPTHGATNVAINANINATFSEPMDPLTVTVTNFKMTTPGLIPFTTNPVAGTISYHGSTATFIPSGALSANTVYTTSMTTGAKDMAGNSMATDYVWNFTTSGDTDSTAPTVTGTINTNGATNVAINTKAGATFSKAMDPLTITNANFMLKETVSGLSVAGTVSYSGVSAVFTPLANLADGRGYTTTIKGGVAGVRDLAGNPMLTDYVLSWKTSATSDTTAPLVTATSITNGSANVAINTRVGAIFSKGLDPVSITNVNVTLKEAVSGISVAGTVSCSGVSATFIPTKNLNSATLYTATVSGGASGVKDLAGNSMAVDYVWSWTTGSATDTTAPMLSGTVNADGATNVALNTKAGATFSETMDPLTITNAIFTLKEAGSGNPVSGTTSCSGTHALFTPSINLSANTRYTAIIKGGVGGAKDLTGNPLASDYVWSWTTTAISDITAPAVILVNPLNLASKVVINSPVTATFSKAMDPLTINTATFKVAGITGVTGLVAYDAINKIATFTPTANFANATTYTATISTEGTDLAGNALAINYVWNFTTATFPPLISLGSASTFGVMARSAITSSGASMIYGDVALSPGTACGLVAGQVGGTIHINDAATVQAATDLATAYAAAKALPAGVVLVAGTDLGGFVNGGAAGVLPPGTYTSGSTMLVTTPLTLDAKGDVNASWVFQVGSSFTTTANVLLANGAQAKNVYWVSTASATIGAGTIFNGNIIAGVTVAAQAGAIINGRILSGATTAGATTLVNVTVNVPAP
jgi:hypothetical protein